MSALELKQPFEIPANQKAQALYRHRLKLLANQMSAETVPGAVTESTNELEKTGRNKKIVFSSEDSAASSRRKVKNRVQKIESENIKRNKIVFSSEDSTSTESSTKNKIKIMKPRKPSNIGPVSQYLTLVGEVALVKDDTSNGSGTDTVECINQQPTKSNKLDYSLKKVASTIRSINIPTTSTNDIANACVGNIEIVESRKEQRKGENQQCNNSDNVVSDSTSTKLVAEKKIDNSQDASIAKYIKNKELEKIEDSKVTILPDTPKTSEGVDISNSIEKEDQMTAKNAIVNSENADKSSSIETEENPIAVVQVDKVSNVVKTLSSVFNKIVPSLSFGNNATFDDESDSGIHEVKSVDIDASSTHSLTNIIHQPTTTNEGSDIVKSEKQQCEPTEAPISEVQVSNIVEYDIHEENQLFVISGIVPGYDRDQTLYTKASFVSDSDNTRTAEEPESSNRGARSWLRFSTKSPLKSRDDTPPCLTTQYIARFETETNTDSDAVEIERVYENNQHSDRNSTLLTSKRREPFVTKFAGAKEANIETALMGRNDNGNTSDEPMSDDSLRKSKRKPVDVFSWMVNKSLDSTDHTSRTNNLANSPDRKVKVGLMDPTRTHMPQGKRVAFLTQLRQLSTRYVNDGDTGDDQASLATDLYSQTDGGESYITSTDNRTILSEPPYLDDEDGTNMVNVFVNNLLHWSDSFECRDLINTLECTDLVTSLSMAKIEAFNDYESFDGSEEYSDQLNEYYDSISPKSTVDHANSLWEKISSLKQKQLPMSTNPSLVKHRVDEIKRKLTTKTEVMQDVAPKISNSKNTNSFVSIDESESVLSYIDDEDEIVRTKSVGATSTVGLRERVEQFVTNAADELIDTISTWDIDDMENNVYEDNNANDVNTSNETDENNISFDTTLASAETEPPTELKRPLSLYTV